MKKLASALLGLLLTGCLATHEGNPLNRNSDTAPVSSKTEAAPVSTTTLWWQKRDGFKPSAPPETADPDEKWQGWSEEELAPVFPKGWKPPPPEPKEKPESESEKPKQPRGEVY